MRGRLSEEKTRKMFEEVIFLQATINYYERINNKHYNDLVRKLDKRIIIQS